MMMEKGTVNSSGEGGHRTQKFQLCGLDVSVFPPEQKLATRVVFPPPAVQREVGGG